MIIKRHVHTNELLYVGIGPLKEQNLVGADFSGAMMYSVDLRKVNLDSADLTGAYLQSADLRGAYLESADLTGADLCFADLTCTCLVRANLCQAQLVGAVLKDANLRHANLRGTFLRSVNLCLTTIVDADFTFADMDFSSGIPLFCGGQKFRGDKQLLQQILAHALSADTYDQEYLAIREAARTFCEGSHIAKRIDWLKKEKS